MAAFTPSNLYVSSIGSAKLSVAHINEDIISGTNYWDSGIPDIISVMPTMMGGTDINVSSASLVVSFTATDGTIHIVNDPACSNTGYALWVLSGLGQDVWNKP